MTSPVSTYVHAADPISRVGVVSQLRGRQEVRVLEEMALDEAEVALVVTDTLDDDALHVMRGLCRGDRPRLILVATMMDDATLVPIVYVKSLDYRPKQLTNVYVWQAYGIYDFSQLGLSR